MPDLTITSATATAQCVNGTVTATIVATVKNGDVNGLADLSTVAWAIVMGATWGATHGEGKLEPTSVKPVNPQLGGPKALKPGESWKGTMTITGLPRYKPGTAYAPAYVPPGYSFEVTADPMNAVTEADEKNNTRSAFTSDPCYVKSWCIRVARVLPETTNQDRTRAFGPTNRSGVARAMLPLQPSRGMLPPLDFSRISCAHRLR